MDPLQPLTDADVPAFWNALDLPGLIDVHVHFLPPPVMERVWGYFESRGPLVHYEWPIIYKGSDDERVGRLREMGVRRFGALPYAHKPGIAPYLNDWARDFAAQHTDALRCATFFPEPGAADEVATRLVEGVDVFKIHVQVGDFDVLDPELARVWEQLESSRTPVVVHAGSGPVANTHTGPAPMVELLARYPGLRAVIAHAGAPEYEGFLDLAERSTDVYLDTTMVFTDFFSTVMPYPDALLPRFKGLQDKVILGTDFPNLPYPYAHQLACLGRLGFGADWLRSVCWDNPARLLGLDASGTAPALDDGLATVAE